VDCFSCRFVPLALIVLGPDIANILVYHALLDSVVGALWNATTPIIRSITHAPDQTVARPQRLHWLTSISPLKGVPAKVVAQIMGHTKVDTTMNVYTQVLDGAARVAADRVGSELFRIVQIPDRTTTPTH
jgi:hypothetical protein